jgi:hypothetical protein
MDERGTAIPRELPPPPPPFLEASKVKGKGDERGIKGSGYTRGRGEGVGRKPSSDAREGGL